MDFIDSDGSVIVPKAVRPIVDLEESLLGAKNDAVKQYRRGKLHVREYDDHYSVHMDRVDPARDPLGHLIIDAPEYIAGATVGLAVGKQVCSNTYRESKKSGKSRKDAALEALVAGYLAGSSAGKIAYAITGHLKRAHGQTGS